MTLLLLILVLAIAGGFLGDLLELAAWLVLLLALVGAALGFFIYRTFAKVRDRID